MMGDGERALSILVKEEQTLKEDPEDLFGKQFDKALGDLVKRKRDSIELKKALHQPNKPSRGSYSRPFGGGGEGGGLGQRWSVWGPIDFRSIQPRAVRVLQQQPRTSRCSKRKRTWRIQANKQLSGEVFYS